MSKITVNMCCKISYKISIRVYLQDSAIRRNIKNTEFDKEWRNWSQRQFLTCRFCITGGCRPRHGYKSVSYTQLDVYKRQQPALVKNYYYYYYYEFILRNTLEVTLTLIQTVKLNAMTRVEDFCRRETSCVVRLIQNSIARNKSVQ